MSRRRWLIALAMLIPLLVAVEVVVRRWERPKATLQIINQGDGIMEDLVVSYGDIRLPLGTLLKGQSVHARMTAGPLGPLKLEFRQKSNALQGFEIPDYDPALNIQDGYKQVIVVMTNQIQRFAEEDDTQGPRKSLWETLWEWFQSDLVPIAK
jgi:hypothetical protein